MADKPPKNDKDKPNAGTLRSHDNAEYLAQISQEPTLQSQDQADQVAQVSHEPTLLPHEVTDRRGTKTTVGNHDATTSINAR